MRASSAVLFAVCLSLPAASVAQSQWRVERGEVRVRCPLTVGGSFEAVTSQISGGFAQTAATPPRFDGELAVDLRTLDTGIGLRNTHLRENYLEVQKGAGFERAVLTDLELGAIDVTTFKGKTTFRGALELHGVTKAVSGTARVQRNGSNVQIDARFPVRLSDHGIEDPRYLGVGVKPEVEVSVTLMVKS